MRAQFGLGHALADVGRHAEEAEQGSAAARHRRIVNLAQRPARASGLAGQALFAPERGVVHGDVLGMGRHPGGGGAPLPGQLLRQGRREFNTAFQQTRRQCQQHMLCAPGGYLAFLALLVIHVFAVQLYLLRRAAQAADRLPGVNARGIQAAVQRVGQCGHAAHQAHRGGRIGIASHPRRWLVG